MAGTGIWLRAVRDWLLRPSPARARVWNGPPAGLNTSTSIRSGPIGPDGPARQACAVPNPPSSSVDARPDNKDGHGHAHQAGNDPGERDAGTGQAHKPALLESAVLGSFRDSAMCHHPTSSNCVVVHGEPPSSWLVRSGKRPTTTRPPGWKRSCWPSSRASARPHHRYARLRGAGTLSWASQSSS